MFFCLNKRKRYVRAMMKAIDIARSNCMISGKPTTKTNGLRAIKTFEKQNRIKFNPRNTSHLMSVYSFGIIEATKRRAKIKKEENIHVY